MDSMKIRTAHDFSINICGMCIPKNALYGRIGKYYWYIDDFAQFKNNRLVCVYLFDKNTGKKFVPCVAKRDNPFISKLAQVIKRDKLYNITCVYPLKMGYRSNTDNFAIHSKKAQCDFKYNASNRDNPRTTTDYACGKMRNWVSYK